MGFLAPAAAAVGPAVIGGGAQLAGSAMAAGSAHEANVMNQQNAREAMAFSERMSSTAWQRGVEDMKKAGINPMLAASQGSASAPQGVAANMQPEIKENILGGAVASALDFARSKAEIKIAEEQGKIAEQQAKKAKADATLAQAAIPQAQAEAEVYSGKFGKAISYGKVAGDALGSFVGGILPFGKMISGMSATAKSAGRVRNAWQKTFDNKGNHTGWRRK